MSVPPAVSAEAGMTWLLLLTATLATASAQLAASFQFPNSGPVKRTYVIHRGADGEPRFGKRSGGVPGAPAEDSPDIMDKYGLDVAADNGGYLENDLEKRKVKNFIRFGKRGDENYDGNDAQFQLGPIFPYKRFGRRRMSNFLRFG